jgi:hypothetical protein
MKVAASTSTPPRKMSHRTSVPTPVNASWDDDALATTPAAGVVAPTGVAGVAVVGVVSGVVVVVVPTTAAGLVVLVVDVVVVDVGDVVVVDVGDDVVVVVVVGAASDVALQHGPLAGDTAVTLPTIHTASTAMDDGLPMQEAGKLSW